MDFRKHYPIPTFMPILLHRKHRPTNPILLSEVTEAQSLSESNNKVTEQDIESPVSIALSNRNRM